MKTHSSKLRALLALTGGVFLSISSHTSAATYYWDGGIVDILTDGNGFSAGGAGTWDTTILNWDGGNSPHIAWSGTTDTAVFGGTAGTVTLGSSVTVGGLQFNTTAYTIATGANTLSLSGTSNILLNNIALATINGTIGGSGDLNLTSSNPATAGTLAFTGATTGGWSGATTIGPNLTMTLDGAASLNRNLLNTSAITLNGGAINSGTIANNANASANRINDAANWTVNSGTFTWGSSNAGGTYAETIGTVTLNRGQMNFVLGGNLSSGSQTLTLGSSGVGLVQTGTSAVTFSNNAVALNNVDDRIRVFGITTDTTAGTIIGPWATVGSSAALQTDYAIYDSDGTYGYVVAAGASLTAPGETGWGSSSTAYQFGAATTLTATRTAAALRYTGAAAALGLGASNFNLETYGILNGGSGILTVSTTGTGGLTTPTGGGNLYLTAGNNGITVSAPINDNGGAVTLVQSGSGTLTLSSTTSNYSGGTVINAGTLATTADTNLGSGGGITVNGTVTWNMGGASPVTYNRSLTVNDGAVLSLTSGNAGKTVTGILSGNGTIIGTATTGYTFTNTGNTFTGIVNNGYQMDFASLGDSTNAINLIGSNSRFNWTGSAKTFALRQFTIQAAGTGIIDNNGTGGLTIEQDLAITGAAGARTLQLEGNNTNTFSGGIANGTSGGTSVVSLTKADAGTWILSGANAYTGTTTISAGTLQIGAGGTTGSLSASGAITNNATLTFNRSNALVQGTDFGSVISGSGAVIKNGAGNLTLSGANTYTGTTTINAGQILMTNALALQNSAYNTTGSNGTTIGLDVSSGLNAGSLTLGGLSGSVNLASAITAGYTGSVTNLILNPQSGVTSTYGGVIADGSGAMTLTKTGAGTQVLNGNNTFSGGINISAGTLQYSGTGSNANAFGASSNVLTFTGNATFHNNDGAFTMAQGIAVNSGVTASLTGAFGESTNIQGAVTGAGDVNISAGSNGWAVTMSNSANTISGTVWVSSNAGQNGSLTVNSLADSANSTKRLKMGATTAAADFTLQGSSTAAIVWTNRAVELAGTTGAISINNNSTSMARSLTISPDLLFTTAGSGNKTLTLGGSNVGTNTFGGIIGNNGASTTGITKAGAGTWILGSSVNAYTGVTTLSAGTLQVSTLANGGASSSIGASTSAAGNLVLNGGTLRYTGGAVSTDRLFSLQVSSNLDSSGTGAINFSNTGSMGFNGGVAAKTLTLTGTNTGNNTIAAVIGNNTAATAITKTSIGTWVLSGANTNTGNTTLSGGGTLVLDYGTNDNSKIAGVLNLNAGTLTLNGGTHEELVTSTTISTAGGHTTIALSGGRTAAMNLAAITRTFSGSAAGGTLSFAADNIGKTSTANNAAGILGGWATVGSNWATVSGGSIVALSSYTAFATSGGVNTINYQLTGDGALTGALVASTLRISNDGNSQTLDLGASRTLSLGQQSSSIAGGLLYAGGNDNIYTITGTGTSRIQNANGNQETLFNIFTGTLNADVLVGNGSGCVTKTGVGTLVLKKANDYTGATYINQGVLRAENNTAAGTTAGGITVFNNAALELANSVAIGAEALSITGTGVSDGGALRNIASNTSSYAGAITIGTGGARINSDAAGSLTLSGGVVTSLFNDVTYGGAGNTTVQTVAISGAGNLIKDGAGILTLSATNTYAGTTTVSTGTLIVNGSISSSSLTTVQSGAIIGGSGTIGALTVSSGGFINPGNSPDTLDVVGAYNQAGTYNAEITANTVGNGTTGYDQISVTGAVNITGGSLVAMFSGGGYAANDLIFILLNDSTDAITGTYAGYANGATVATHGGFNWNISYFADSTGNAFTGGNDIALMAEAIPEPKAALLGALGILLLLRRRR